jgi:hypothetical protein
MPYTHANGGLGEQRLDELGFGAAELGESPADQEKHEAVTQHRPPDRLHSAAERDGRRGGLTFDCIHHRLAPLV